MNLVIIFAAKYVYLVSVLVFVYYAYTAPDRKEFIRVAIVVAVLAFALSLIASALYYNPRPFMLEGAPAPLIAHAPGNGFPSDHVLFTGTLASIVTIVNPYGGAVLWVLALVVSAGRVLAGVHHTLDVVASLIISAGSAALVWAVFRRYYASPGK
ncbi:hypothetical protein COU19_01070 [Candidatus Kaiserbacteria bacterium CG10_big_fil_rev_8_21_14_0_10_56_12]|uniref:Phosphatidic acid phosphatase type 2/haloperoxidase domain-containing protein n=1 Tax=Candidatus Kaiserbacteria bacterium CG10_big_fil_rev_8_21_14_0_10_56_12 TaxID=1974611 RepID=A0A2H0UA76_9BACT|nr:MAG: hypothetical protein COU19_01070 [Candidatus Kaiserbacteria bacterium CG10_big_fil_rev_8_21_14_0_10_56_12]